MFTAAVQACSVDHALRWVAARRVDTRYRDGDARSANQAAHLTCRGREAPRRRAGETGEAVAGMVGDGGRIDLDVVAGGIVEIGAQIDREGGTAQVQAEVGRRVGNIKALDDRSARGLPDGDEAGAEDDRFAEVDDQIVGGRVFCKSVGGAQQGDLGGRLVGDHRVDIGLTEGLAQGNLASRIEVQIIRARRSSHRYPPDRCRGRSPPRIPGPPGSCSGRWLDVSLGIGKPAHEERQVRAVARADVGDEFVQGGLIDLEWWSHQRPRPRPGSRACPRSRRCARQP